ncbi:MULTISPECIES: hypothetical protein [unclassified Nocardiopsis]|uniref:hypothetical protein n=1 Tax=unclassified Nocardiopsis TaxID=2649073 RepID=UPI0013590F0A|nr:MULTISPECIES: hypothetical protein [unclassified Nocardiopsis]
MSAERTRPPLPDYEELSLQDLSERVRSLPAERVRELIAYEESHAERMEVLEVLEDRLTKLEGRNGFLGGSGPEGEADPDGQEPDADAVPHSAERPPDRGPDHC